MGPRLRVTWPQASFVLLRFRVRWPQACFVCSMFEVRGAGVFFGWVPGCGLRGRRRLLLGARMRATWPQPFFVPCSRYVAAEACSLPSHGLMRSSQVGVWLLLAEQIHTLLPCWNNHSASVIARFYVAIRRPQHLTHSSSSQHCQHMRLASTTISFDQAVKLRHHEEKIPILRSEGIHCIA